MSGSLLSNADERVWGLVRAAGELRARGHYGEALEALDLAWHLGPSEQAELALYACGIAIHCDCGEYELALRVEGSFAERGIDLRLSLAFQRLHDELFDATGDERHRERRDFYRAFVGLFDSVAA